MKATTRQYARSLYEAAKGKTGPELEKVIAGFVRLLGERRELGKTPAIIADFRSVWDEEEGEISAELVTARTSGSAAAVGEYLKGKTGAKKVALREEVDPKIIGGFVLRYRDKILDASLRSGLENLQNKLGR